MAGAAVSRPLVLIVGRLASEAEGVRGAPFAAGRRYFESIVRAGGTPLMLPPIEALVADVDGIVARVDAVVLHGGGDVDPRRYGQAPIAEELYGIVEVHDEVELAVVRAVLARDMPLLAVCRGMHILNVALGGTLRQDIGSQEHRFHYHEVALDPASRVAAAVGGAAVARAHCVHHQALDVVADGLRVVGRTADGLVHAAEVDGARWAVATQWHPEDSSADDAQQQRLFDAVVDAAR